MKISPTQATMLHAILKEGIDAATNSNDLRHAQERVENLSPLLPPEERTQIRAEMREAIAEARKA